MLYITSVVAAKTLKKQEISSKFQFRPAFGVRSTQTLVEIYNNRNKNLWSNLIFYYLIHAFYSVECWPQSELLFIYYLQILFPTQGFDPRSLGAADLYLTNKPTRPGAPRFY